MHDRMSWPSFPFNFRTRRETSLPPHAPAWVAKKCQKCLKCLILGQKEAPTCRHVGAGCVLTGARVTGAEKCQEGRIEKVPWWKKAELEPRPGDYRKTAARAFCQCRENRRITRKPGNNESPLRAQSTGVLRGLPVHTLHVWVHSCAAPTP